MQSHAWAQLSNRVILDITGDQFKNRSVFLNYSTPVYIGRVDDSVEKVNERIALYSPEGSWKNNQNRTSVLYYLNLDKPDENYIFKATEANDWANCAEFGEDIGNGRIILACQILPYV